MIEYYKRAIKIIEKLFGESWLANKRGEKGSGAKSNLHPVQHIWKSSRKFLKLVEEGSKDFRFVDGLTELADMADVLDIASKIENFDTLIFPKLKNRKNPTE